MWKQLKRWQPKLKNNKHLIIGAIARFLQKRFALANAHLLALRLK